MSAYRQPTMSTDSFPCRSSNSRNPYSRCSGDRRRQWLMTRGLLSPHNGPSRRLANLLPRKQPVSPAASTKYTSTPHSSAHIRLEVDQNAVPVVVAKPPKLDNEDGHPSATRTVSMPHEHLSRHRNSAFRSRSNHRRWVPKEPEQVTPSPSRGRRFLNRLRRRSRDLPQPHSRISASMDVPRSHDRDADRLFLHRHSLDRKREPTAATTNGRPRARAMYTVFDKDLPRNVLQGTSRFEKSAWNDYRDHIDELAEDPKFMDYLTAPVQRRPPLRSDTGHADVETQSLAVNKLYPLAFIRLLEAHAKYSAESSEPNDPDDEDHRYDDVERDDEARVERTCSNGMYDMGRFRTVGGNQLASPGFLAADEGTDYDSPGAFGGKKKPRESPYHSRLFSRISRDSEVPSVSVF